MNSCSLKGRKMVITQKRGYFKLVIMTLLMSQCVLMISFMVVLCLLLSIQTMVIST